MMNAFRCLRLAARPTNASTPLRPTLGHLMSRTSHKPITARNLSILAPRRPILPATTFAPTTSLPPPSCTLDSTGAALDLVPQSSISAHPGFGSIQIRCGPRDTYNPSHLVRKRRHGFLARLKSKKGRKLLMRRIKKGRWNLSH